MRASIDWATEALRRRGGTLACLLGSVLIMVMVSSLGIGNLSEVVETDRAFNRARPCRPAPAARAGCVSERTFTVTHLDPGRITKRRRPGSGRPARVVLTSPIGDWKSVELSVDAPILERIRVGDTVVGVVWRDDVIWIKAKGLKERTVDTPVHPESLLGAMLAADPAGMLIVAVCVWRLRHRRRRLTRGMWVLLGLAFGSLATGVAVSVAGARLDLPLWFGPAAWLLVMANLTVLAVVTARRPAQPAPAPAPASNWGKEFGS